MEIPYWLKKYLNVRDGEKINQAVKSAELLTSGEIVPILVQRSSTVGHVPQIIFLLIALLFFLVSEKNIFSSLGIELYIEVFFWALSTLGLYFLSIVISKNPFVQRLFTSPKDLAMQVDMRAEVEFYEAGLNQTVGATGILLFVSAMERRAVVLADKAIAEKLPPETWDNVVQYLILGIKKKDMATGFCRAIEECGNILAKHFPRQDNDINELKDHLIIK